MALALGLAAATEDGASARKMLTEPPAALTTDIMIAMTTTPVTAPAAPAAAAAVAVRPGPRPPLHTPGAHAGPAATTSAGTTTGRAQGAPAPCKTRPPPLGPGATA